MYAYHTSFLTLFFHFTMWYIIKTDYYKERDAIKDLLRLDSIEDIYFPNSRPKPEDIGWDKEKSKLPPRHQRHTLRLHQRRQVAEKRP